MPYKRNDVWYTDVTINNKRVRVPIRGCTNERAAGDYETKLTKDAFQEECYGVKKAQKIKFKVFSARYIAEYAKPRKPKSYFTDEIIVKNLNSFFGEYDMSEIPTTIVEKFKFNYLNRVRSTHPNSPKTIQPATVNRALACLSKIFNCAIKWGVIYTKNPVSGVERFQESPGRVRFLEENEIQDILNACDERLRAVVLVALNTGMRKSELRRLSWQDLDFKRNLVKIGPEQKNGERDFLPLNPTAKETLMRIPRDPKNSRLFDYDWGSTFERITQKLKIKDFHFHDLRHTFASYMGMRHVDLNEIRQLMRHKSLKMTIRYTHLSPEYKQDAVNRLSDVFSLKNVTNTPPKENLEIQEEIRKTS